MRHIENEDLSAVINLLKTGAISLDERDEVRDWSLITGRGATKLEGDGKSFSHAKGGAQKDMGYFLRSS